MPSHRGSMLHSVQVSLRAGTVADAHSMLTKKDSLTSQLVNWTSCDVS